MKIEVPYSILEGLRPFIDLTDKRPQTHGYTVLTENGYAFVTATDGKHLAAFRFPTQERSGRRWCIPVSLIDLVLAHYKIRIPKTTDRRSFPVPFTIEGDDVCVDTGTGELRESCVPNPIDLLLARPELTSETADCAPVVFPPASLMRFEKLLRVLGFKKDSSPRVLATGKDLPAIVYFPPEPEFFGLVMPLFKVYVDKGSAPGFAFR